MKNCSRAVLMALAAGSLLAEASSPPARARSAAPADQLIEKVLEARKIGEFRGRAKLTRFTAGSEARDVRQLLIKRRHDGDTTMTLYQVLWPAGTAGDALVIENSADQQPKGFLYQADTVTPLTGAMLGARWFESDLRIEDVAEGFWHWPSHKIGGEDTVGSRRCVVLEFRPRADTPTAYSLVKACVAADLALALRVEQFGRDGQPVKQIVASRLVRRQNRWLAGNLTVVTADRQSRTLLEGSRYEQAPVPAIDFTINAVKNFRRGGAGR